MPSTFISSIPGPAATRSRQREWGQGIMMQRRFLGPYRADIEILNPMTSNPSRHIGPPEYMADSDLNAIYSAVLASGSIPPPRPSRRFCCCRICRGPYDTWRGHRADSDAAVPRCPRLATLNSPAFPSRANSDAGGRRQSSLFVTKVRFPAHTHEPPLLGPAGESSDTEFLFGSTENVKVLIEYSFSWIRHAWGRLAQSRTAQNQSTQAANRKQIQDVKKQRKTALITCQDGKTDLRRLINPVQGPLGHLRPHPHRELPPLLASPYGHLSCLVDH